MCDTAEPASLNPVALASLAQFVESPNPAIVARVSHLSPEEYVTLWRAQVRSGSVDLCTRWGFTVTHFAITTVDANW